MLAALGFLAASCAEDIEPAQPQYNPQEPILNAADDIKTELAGVLAEATGTDAKTIALADYSEPDAVVPVLKAVEVKNLPAGGELIYKLQISSDASFDPAHTATLVAEPGSGDDENLYSINAVTWDEAQVEVFGNSPKVQHAYYRVPVYISLAGTEYRVSGNNAEGESLGTNWYAFQGEFDITRMTPNYVIEDNYYCFGKYLGNNTPANGFVMTHSDLDAYDDPNFSYAFKVSADEAAAGFTVMIAPESVVKAGGAASQCFGVEDPTATEGALVLGGQPLTITQEGPYKLDVDMKALTYKVAVAPESLYIASNGAQFNAKCLQLGTSDFISYTGMAYIDKWFRITAQKGFNGVNYGPEDPDMTNELSANIAINNNQIPVPVKGFKGLFWMDVNLGKMMYTAYAINTLGVVGTINNWGNENADGSVTPDTPLSHTNNDFNVWTGEFEVKDATADKPAEVKIRANNEWTVDFGEVAGSTDAVKGGANITISENGTYSVSIDFSSLPYQLVITKK